MVQFFIVLIIHFLNFAFCDKECGLENVQCTNISKYRSIDGSCNNLKNSNWGTIYSTYDRLLPPKYGDGVSSFPKALSGNDLPNPRKMSSKIYIHNMTETVSKFSLGVMQYGQFLTHDLSLGLIPIGQQDCCTRDMKFLNKKDISKFCAPIPIPQDDPSYSSVNATCLSFGRVATNKDLSCSQSLKHAEQIINCNSYLDLSVIYGNTLEDHNMLRSFKNGTLHVNIRNNKEWFLNHPDGSAGCSGTLNSEEICYISGDFRLNQSPQLAILHLLWIRNHNKVARELKMINPHWNDERLFQETRRINIAEHQYISYYELLPIYLGKESLLYSKILYDTDGFVNDYDETIKPNVYNEHAQAAFRQFHSLVAGKLNVYNPSGCPYDSLVLRDHFDRPVALEKYKLFDGLIRGLAMQPQMESDIYHDPEITRHFQMKDLRFGSDIKAVDIQRSRDHGLASYNSMRSYCGLKKAKEFTDFLDVMDKDKMEILVSHYEKPDDVDLIVGGSMERNIIGTLAGPTFLCIMKKQFYKTRKSDRFWFENKNNGLTLPQLNEIRKFSISKLFCDNGNDIKVMQLHGFLTVSLRNPRYPCRFIKGPNLQLWKEY